MQVCGSPLKVGLFMMSVAAVLCALGCGGGNNTLTPNSYAYVNVYENNQSSVAQYQVAADGTLKPLIPAMVPAGSNIIGLVPSPDNKYLFALNNNEYPQAGTFLRFTINSNGSLAPNPVTSQTGPIGESYPFALTPNGQFAIVPNVDAASSYSISASGTLTLVNTIAAGRNACSVAIDPSGRFVYVGNFQDNTISEFKISSTGTLSAIGTISSAPTSVYFLKFSPQGFLYSAGCCALQAVTEYSLDSSTGALTLVNNFPSGNSESSIPWSFAFDPSGNHAYAANTASTISGYTISSFTVNSNTGALTGVGNTSTEGDYQIAVDPSGKFVFALSRDAISQFKVGDSAMLISNGTTSPAGSIPNTTAGAIAFAQK